MNTYPSISPRIAAIMACFVLGPAPLVFAQGSLTPSGAPAPTMKTLDQVEPRTPISSLPATLTTSGSYYLTGNLTSAGGGLTIQANEVTVDLMGFTLAGGTGPGIFASGIRENIVIRNCTVRGWTNGIDIPGARNSQLEGLRISGNSGYGVRIGTGIITLYGITVSDCTASFNTGNGISVGDGSTVISCTAKGNGVDGIITASLTTGCTISGCTANANNGDGIEVSSSCLVTGNTRQGNGNGASDGAGINAAGSRNRIDSNTVMANDRGIDCNPATANLIIRNSARGNTANYDILAGNNSGAIIVTPGVGFVATNPWANFEF